MALRQGDDQRLRGRHHPLSDRLSQQEEGLSPDLVFVRSVNNTISPGNEVPCQLVTTKEISCITKRNKHHFTTVFFIYVDKEVKL